MTRISSRRSPTIGAADALCFFHTCKSVLHDATYHSFDTMEEYRKWDEENLPNWLGYSRVWTIRRR